MSKHPLFPDLRPPTGGLVALRTRLAAKRRQRLTWGLTLATVATLLLFTALPSAPVTPLPNDIGLVAFGLFEPGGPIEVTHGTAGQPVALSNPSVVFYRVAATQAPVQP